tara:strand:- start:137 stop:337 length:201 start_codon:yes stop_codon:yes gene_type:complete
MKVFKKLKRFNTYWACTIVSEKGIENLYLTDSELHRVRKRSRVANPGGSSATFWARLHLAWLVLWQ